jgi:hypothetical protein
MDGCEPMFSFWEIFCQLAIDKNPMQPLQKIFFEKFQKFCHIL